MNDKILTGKTHLHINQDYSLHKDCVDNFIKLENTLFQAGHKIKIVSGFRDFKRQLFIWNQKAQGKRELLDEDGRLLKYSDLSKEELLFSILRWSALPGAGRHHWGTDFDIIDTASIDKDYIVKLTPEEVGPSGPFYKMHSYIDKLIQTDQNFPFFRPYKEDLGGVAPEKWHLSYWPISNIYQKEYSYEFFRNFLKEVRDEDFMLFDLVLKHQEKIYHEFINNTSS